MSWCVLEFVEIQRFTKGESRMATLRDVTPGPCAEEIIGEPGYDRLRPEADKERDASGA